MRVILALLVLLCSGCASVERTMGTLDYVCVDITIDTTVSDSGVLGRGIIIPEGEVLTTETLDLLCNY